MPSYHVAAVAFAVGADPKWIDNLLSHWTIKGASGGQRGVARKIEPTGVVSIAVIRTLTASLGMPIERAIQCADQLTAGGIVSIDVAAGVTLSVDSALIGRTVESRLAEASEMAVQPRRGRPSSLRHTETDR